MKKRLLMVGHSPNMAGAEYSLLRLITVIQSKFDIEVLAPGSGLFEKEVRVLGIKFYDLNLNYPFRICGDEKTHLPSYLEILLSQTKSLKDKIQKPDLIHTNTFFVYEGAILAAEWDIPHVWNLREILSDNPTWEPIWSWNETRKRMNALTDSFIAVSSALKESLSDEMKEKTDVIVNGLDAKEILSREQARKEFKDRWGIEEGTKVLVTIGNFIKEKGHQFLLPVIKQLVSEKPNIRFLWVGQHQMTYNEVKQELDRNGLAQYVISPGHIDGFGKLLAGADVYLLSSSTEACPTTVLESKRAGVPVVARDCGGAKELLEYGGGITVGLDDQEAFTNAIRQVLDESNSLPEPQKDPFTMEMMGEKYSSIYLDTINKYKANSERKMVLSDFESLYNDLQYLNQQNKTLETIKKSRLGRLGFRLLKKLFG